MAKLATAINNITMKLELSDKRLNDAGIKRITSQLKIPSEIKTAEWIAAVSWEGHRVAAFPISSIFHQAPPVIAVEKDGWHDGGIDNRKKTSHIAKNLKKHCKDKGLKEAIEIVKAAMRAITG